MVVRDLNKRKQLIRCWVLGVRCWMEDGSGNGNGKRK